MRIILPQGPFLSNVQSHFSFSSIHLLFLRAAVREAACSPCTLTSLATWHWTQHGQRKEAQQSQQQFPWELQEGSVTSQVSNSFTAHLNVVSGPGRVPEPPGGDAGQEAAEEGTAAGRAVETVGILTDQAGGTPGPETTWTITGEVKFDVDQNITQIYVQMPQSPQQLATLWFQE